MALIKGMTYSFLNLRHISRAKSSRRSRKFLAIFSSASLALFLRLLSVTSALFSKKSTSASIVSGIFLTICQMAAAVALMSAITCNASFLTSSRFAASSSASFFSAFCSLSNKVSTLVLRVSGSFFSSPTALLTAPFMRCTSSRMRAVSLLMMPKMHCLKLV